MDPWWLPKETLHLSPSSAIALSGDLNELVEADDGIEVVNDDIVNSEDESDDDDNDDRSV